MKGSFVHSTVGRWPIATALLLLAVAAPTLAGGSISGTLKAAGGLSVDGARVNAANDKFHTARAEVGEDGAYEITDLDPGKYSVVIVGKGLETIVVRDVEVKDGQAVKKDYTLEAAKPFPIVYSPAAIPLTDDINSASFADAPDININEAWQIRSGANDGWAGPSEVGGRLRLKFSDKAFHLAGDLSFRVPGLNNVDKRAENSQLWNGNSVEFFWQNDPYNVNRTEYDGDHNWQAIIALGEGTVDWAEHQPSTGPVTPKLSPASHILRRVKDDKTGEFVRIDMPWEIFPTSAKGSGSAAAMKVGDLGALDIVINSANFDVDRADAAIKAGLSWSGYGPNWNNPSVLKPIKFVTQQ